VKTLRSWFDRLADTNNTHSPAGQALLEERYRALQRQTPLLYLVIVTIFLGMHIVSSGLVSNYRSPVWLLAGLVVLRMTSWLRSRNRTRPYDQVYEFRKAFAFTLLLSLLLSGWVLYLLSQGGEHYYPVVLIGSLAAVGIAYGASSYPAAARLPPIFVGLPLALTLLNSSGQDHIGMGVSLLVVIVLILRQLGVQNESFTQLVGSRSEVTAGRERARQAEALATLLANTDALTRLPNRRSFLRSLDQWVERAGQGGKGFALAVADLDGFKPINDTFGHAAGDALLDQVGCRLAAAAGPAALTARMGGDEFALLLPQGRLAEDAKTIGRAISSALQQPFQIEGREFRISGCCGLALVSGQDCDAREALLRADTALFAAKGKGRGEVALFSPEMDAINQRRVQIEKALRLPETWQKIYLVFQPVRDISTGELRAFEALARWDDEALGPVSPDDFIAIAEHINVITELSDILLAKAAAETIHWTESVRLSFNISAMQLCTVGSSQTILDIVQKARMNPARLQVEITETALMADFATARDNLRRLRAAGVRIVLDDFGSGHASIIYLREMSFDGVKLDGSFITSAMSLRRRRLLSGVLGLCTALGLPCIAEQIETEEQLALLLELGCRDGQGFLLSPPLSAETARLLASPALAANSMSSTIAAIRADTKNVASEIDEVEQTFGEVDEQMARFKASAGKFVQNFAA